LSEAWIPHLTAKGAAMPDEADFPARMTDRKARAETKATKGPSDSLWMTAFVLVRGFSAGTIVY
jgi:hypothetical protein